MKNLPINYDTNRRPLLPASMADERLEKLEAVYEAAMELIHELSVLDPVAVELFASRPCKAVKEAT